MRLPRRFFQSWLFCSPYFPQVEWYSHLMDRHGSYLFPQIWGRVTFKMRANNSLFFFQKRKNPWRSIFSRTIARTRNGCRRIFFLIWWDWFGFFRLAIHWKHDLTDEPFMISPVLSVACWITEYGFFSNIPGMAFTNWSARVLGCWNWLQEPVVWNRQSYWSGWLS